MGKIIGVKDAAGIEFGLVTDGVLVERNIWGTSWPVIVGVTAGSFIPQVTEPTMLTASNKRIKSI